MPNETQIKDTASIGVPPPPSGESALLPIGARHEVDIKADGTQEYVAGGYWSPIGNYIQTLPEWIDPNEVDFGLDIYDRMNTDPQVGSCIDIYKSSVLADGWRISAAKDAIEVTDAPTGDTAPKVKKISSAQASEAADFCRDCLTGMHETPFDLFLRQMLDGIFQGHKVAEIVLEVAKGGKWKGDLVLCKLKTKPRRSTAFVMDSYQNLIGILGMMPNMPFWGMWSAYGMTPYPGDGRDALQKNAPAILPRSKFAVFTYDGQDGSPQGRSLLRRAFTPWWWKENCYAIWGKFIRKHADPSLVGTAAEGATGMTPALDVNGHTVPDSQGNPITVNAVQALAQQLANFANGSYIALPNGASLEALDVKNDGNAIEMFFDHCNKEIAKAILGQTLATEEGQHASRAQAGVHAESKDDVTRYGQVLLTSMVINDILRLLTLTKYGPDATYLIPEFGLGQEETMSLTDASDAISKLVTCGFLHLPSQAPGLDEMAGLPPRDIAAWKADMDADKEAAAALTAKPPTQDDPPPDDAGDNQS